MKKPSLFLVIFLVLIIPPLSGGGAFLPASLNFYLPQILLLLAFSLLALKGEIYSSPLYYPLLAFSFFSLISLIWSIDKDASLKEALRIISCLSIFPLALRLEKEEEKPVLFALSLSSGFIALYGIVEYFRARFIMGDPTWRIFSTFINPNILAGFLATTILPTLVLYLISRKGEIILGLLLIAQLFALFLTGSRGGFVALAGASIFLLIVMIRLKTYATFLKKGIPLLLFFSLLAYLSGSLKPLSRRVAGGGTIEAAQSGAFRTLLWKSSMEMIKAKPLGWGSGTFELVYPRFAIGGFSRTAHNSYLQFASELGIQGLLALLSFLFLLAYHIHKRHPQLPQNEAFLLGSLLSGIFASALHSLVDYDWQIIANFFLLFLLSGLSASQIGLKGKRIQKGFALFPLILLLLTADLALSNHYLEAGKKALRDDPWRAEECFKLSLQLAPFKGEARWYLGLIRMEKNKEEGLKLMKESLAQHPYPPNFYQLGKTFISLGRKQEAELWFRKTLEVDPHSLPAYVALGELLKKEGKMVEAKRIFQRILEIEKSPYEETKPIAFFKEPAYPIAKLELAKMILRENKKEAQKLLEEAERQFMEYLSTYRQWKEVIERFTYVSEQEIDGYLGETKNLLKELSSPR